MSSVLISNNKYIKKMEHIGRVYKTKCYSL